MFYVERQWEENLYHITQINIKAGSPGSLQVVYQEVETYNGDSRTRLVTETNTIEELYPGRNYSIRVAAVSKGVESDPVPQTYIATSTALYLIFGHLIF